MATVALSGEKTAHGTGKEDTKRDKTDRFGGLGAQTVPQYGGTKATSQAIILGVEFLLKSVDEKRHRVPWPIGFYFAKLWYHERLYPLIFTMAALGKYLQLAADQPTRNGSSDETTPLKNPTQTLPEV